MTELSEFKSVGKEPISILMTDGRFIILLHIDTVAPILSANS